MVSNGGRPIPGPKKTGKYLTENDEAEVLALVAGNVAARRARETGIDTLIAALRQADLAMKHAQWGTSHPARLAIAKAIADQHPE
jgi:hypothetical protein